MAVLQSTNVQGTLCVNGVVIGGGKDYNYCCFTASTTFTPTSDLVGGDGFVAADIVGAGGGGGGAYVIGKAGRSPSGGACCANLNRVGGNGAGGGFYATQSFITSTNNITVTVGASGSGGGPQDGIATVVGQLAAVYSASAVLPANFTATTAGGTSAFNGVTAYGGCSGQSCFVICKACGQQTSYCVCNVAGNIAPGTVTKAGLYGAFRYDPYNRINPVGNCGNTPQANANTGVVFCTTIFPSVTASQDVHIPIEFNDDGLSGIGMVGASSCRPCGVFANCGVTSNCSPDVSVNSSANGVVNPLAGFGNGGAGGRAYACSTVCNSGDEFNTSETASGAAGSSGIVVIRWYE